MYQDWSNFVSEKKQDKDDWPETQKKLKQEADDFKRMSRHGHHDNC